MSISWGKTCCQICGETFLARRPTINRFCSECRKSYIRKKCAMRAKVFYYKYKSKISNLKKQYYEKNRVAILQRLYLYRLENPEKFRAARLKNKLNVKLDHDRYRKMLGNGYIKSMLVYGTSLKAADISTSLIEAKRQQLKIKRYIKTI